jgi:PAS domain S-box-containing protein
MDADRQSPDDRVLVFVPTAKDAALTESVLSRAGVACVRCSDLAQVCQELEVGAGAVLLPEEVVVPEKDGRLAEWLARQPPWSDLPVLVLARPGADSAAVALAMDLLGNVTVLERPTRVAALVSAVRTALRARRRQLQIRDYLVERERNIEAQALLAAIVASSDDAIISKNLEGVILTWNDGARRLFGYSAEEAIGRPITLLIPPERHAEEPILLERLRRGERIEHFETVRIAKDGTRLDISLTVSPIRDAEGGVVGASKVARDITQSKRAEAALRLKEERFRQMANSTPAIIWTADPTGAITFHNQRWLDYTGISREDNVRDWPTVLHPDDLERCTRAWTAALSQGTDYEIEVRNRRHDGEYRWFLTRATPIRGADGRIVEWYGSTTDIHDRKLAEESLRDADRRKDEFLAVLAHELRNPLAPIRNSLHILRMTSQHDPAAERVGEMMERQVSHMVRLVDDLMEVSRITRGKIELRKESVEVAAIVRSAMETSRPLIEAGGHQLALSIPPEPLTLEGDPVRLTQVVANLLNNAAKYTDEGGQIWLTVRREDDEVAISVRDTGTGIPPEMLPRVFDLFTQIDRHANRSQGGLGIGLTLVKSLIEMHGGSVEARSEGVGRGSEFVLRLPLALVPRPAADLAAQTNRSTVLSARRVLVVDDNRDAAESLGMLLRLLGAEVHVVCSGPDAFEALATYQPSVVLLDIGMPGMDGYEVARRIRQEPEYRGVTLIALTGWGQEEDRRRTQDAGFDYHLTKPAELTTLQTLLVSLAGRRENC